MATVRADIKTGLGIAKERSALAATKSTQNFVYSQSYYLYRVRNELRSSEQLKYIDSPLDAAELRSGDFVEYQATFRPNEVNTVLDILTPELVGEITRYKIKQEGLLIFEADDLDFDRRTRLIEQNHAKAENMAGLARAIAGAVRADFRSEKTREFYGAIGAPGNQVTAVTICENEHFIVSDEDRILDGEFTVLGKVISSAETDVPILKRNKLLERFQPKAVDAASEFIRSTFDDQAAPFGDNGETLNIGDLVDLNFASRIDGTSFRVIPIAIYA
jgi:hypothetical protein